MKLVIALAVCVTGVSAHAQFAGQPPLIYFNRLTGKSAIGEWNSKVQGFTIAAPDWSRSIQLLAPADVSLRFYMRTNYGLIPDWQLGVNGKPVLAVLQCYQGTNTQYRTNAIATAYASGKVGTFTNNGVGWQGAKTLTWTSHNFTSWPQDMTGTLVLDVADTFSQPQGSTVDTVAASFVASFTNGFFEQLPDPFQ